MGEGGLVATAGAEFMALETTEEAGTCLAFRSMLGLVGSSGVGGQHCRRGWDRMWGLSPCWDPPRCFLVGLKVSGMGDTLAFPQQS